MKDQKCRTKGGTVIVAGYLIAQNRSRGNFKSYMFIFNYTPWKRTWEKIWKSGFAAFNLSEA